MILEQIKDAIAEQLSIEKDTITAEAKIIDDLGADSLDIVELVMTLEETFNIKIEDSQVKELSTVADLVAFVEKNQ